MERKKTIITLVLVAIAISASLYIVPALAHPYWAEEEVGEDFTPPCLADGEYENATYGYGPFHNGTCPWAESTEEGGAWTPGSCWGNGGNQGSGPRVQSGSVSGNGQRSRGGGYGGRRMSRGC
jgi:hypothetical protein